MDLKKVSVGAIVLLGMNNAAPGQEERKMSGSRAATVVLATKDSSDRSKAGADVVCDGRGDQEEITAAIRGLPPAGGAVLLMEGRYDIRKVDGTLGGIIIDRSHVTLAGQGTATRLVLAPDQNTNVIRIIGGGVGHITIRDLVVDADREHNNQGEGDRNISHDRYEFCGVKAWRQAPRGPATVGETHDVTIRNCTIKNAQRLGLMLQGPNMRVLDNILGNAGSDSVELLGGPGVVRGNYVEITGQTHVAIGSDAGNSIIMSGNIVHVRKGGKLDIAFRSWAGSQRHVISGNVLTVDPGGECTLAVDVRGFGAAVTGNNLHGVDETDRTRLQITGGNTLVTGNFLDNIVVEVNDRTGANKPILVDHNIMDNSEIDHRKGNLMPPRAPATGSTGKPD